MTIFVFAGIPGFKGNPIVLNITRWRTPPQPADKLLDQEIHKMSAKTTLLRGNCLTDLASHGPFDPFDPF